MHIFYSPANSLYEIILGFTCLAILFGSVFSIPTLAAMLQENKEAADRQNK